MRMRKQSKTQRKRQLMKMRTPPPRRGLEQGRVGNEVGVESEERVISALVLLQEKLKREKSKIQISYFKRSTPHSLRDKQKKDIVILLKCGRRIEWCAIQVKTSKSAGQSFKTILKKEMRKLEASGKTLPKTIPKLVIAKEHDSIFDIMDSTSKALGLRVSA